MRSQSIQLKYSDIVKSEQWGYVSHDNCKIATQCQCMKLSEREQIKDEKVSSVLFNSDTCRLCKMPTGSGKELFHRLEYANIIG